MLRATSAACATALLALSSAAPAAAAPETPYGGVLSLQVENDFFAALTNTDEHYTNGLRFEIIDPPLKPTSAVHDWPIWRLLDWGGDGDTRYRQVGVAVGQGLFTPDDTDRSDLVRDDRPYAGWLYVAGLMQQTLERDDRPVRQDTWRLQIGVVGPSARGEAVQNNFHDVIGVGHANGWDNQLRDELAFALTAERKWQVALGDVGAGLAVDVVPYAAASLGTLNAYGAGGALLRLGRDLTVDFGPPRILPGAPGSVTMRRGGSWAWYVFAGVEARAVARNIFLDGNTFRSSHDVGHRSLVGDVQIGAALVVGATRISATHVIRTAEFDEQDEADQFGAISVTVGF